MSQDFSSLKYQSIMIVSNLTLGDVSISSFKAASAEAIRPWPFNLQFFFVFIIFHPSHVGLISIIFRFHVSEQSDYQFLLEFSYCNH